MKSKLSVTVEDNILSQLDVHVKSGMFRNKSHLVEFAINKFLEERK